MDIGMLVVCLAIVAGALGGLGIYEVLMRFALPGAPLARSGQATDRGRRDQRERERKGTCARIVDVVSNALARFAPLSRADADACKRRLTEAGVKAEPETWRGLRAVCALGCAGTGALCMSAASASLALCALAALAGLAVGAGLPQLYLARRERARKRAIETRLPDVMELLGVALAAGSPVEQCFREVASSIDGPLSEELSIVDQEVNLLGHTREKALEHLADRCNSRDVSAFVAQLTQAIGQGSSIAEGLAAQASLARETAQARALEKIRTMPTKLDIVLSLCFLPPTVALVVVPTVVDLLHFLNETMG